MDTETEEQETTKVFAAMGRDLAVVQAYNHAYDEYEQHRLNLCAFIEQTIRTAGNVPDDEELSVRMNHGCDYMQRPNLLQIDYIPHIEADNDAFEIGFDHGSANTTIRPKETEAGQYLKALILKAIDHPDFKKLFLEHLKQAQRPHGHLSDSFLDAAIESPNIAIYTGEMGSLHFIEIIGDDADKIHAPDSPLASEELFEFLVAKERGEVSLPMPSNLALEHHLLKQALKKDTAPEGPVADGGRQ